MLEIRGPPSFVKKNLRKKVVLQDFIGLHQNINRDIMNQEFGQVEAQRRVISDARREVLSI